MLRTEIRNFSLKYSDYDPIPCDVPCSLYSVLFAAGKIPDPLVGDHAKKLTSLSYEGCEFTAAFEPSATLLSHKNVSLRFFGLDTVAEVVLNGVTLGFTDNMFVTYTFDVKNLLRAGENTLTVKFSAPAGSVAYYGASYTRKAAFMSGSEYSPNLPDMGIYRKVELIGYNTAVIDHCVVSQRHENGKVTLDISVQTLGKSDGNRAVATLVSPGGKMYYAGLSKGRGSVTITDPTYWWPHTLGNPSLYRLTVTLYHESDAEDIYEANVGLRTVQIDSSAETSEGGPACYVNGIRCLLLGATYLPEDVLICRTNRNRTEELIRAAAEANVNVLRISASTYYPADDFYSLCDRYGILVFQDVMQAPENVRMDTRYVESMREEFRSNLPRFAKHPSFAFLCYQAESENEAPVYQKALEDELKRTASGVALIRTVGKPSGTKEQSSNVDLMKEIPEESLMTDFGISSLPALPTLRAIDESEKPNIFSATFEAHQNREYGNIRIVSAAATRYLYAYRMEDLVYTTQLYERDLLREAAFSQRISRDSKMGVIFDTFNDTWPEISRSFVDFFGRRKAVYYGAKEFFSPLLVIACQEGPRVAFYVSNERRTPFTGNFIYTVRDSKNHVIFEEFYPITVSAMATQGVFVKNFRALITDHEEEYYVVYRIADESGIPSSGTVLFVPPKRFHYEFPDLRVQIIGSGNAFEATVAASAYAGAVELSFDGIETELPENFFDVTDSMPIRIPVKVLGEPTTAEALRSALRVRSLYDVGRQ